MDQELADAEARLTKLRHAFVAAADDPDKRRLLSGQIYKVCTEISQLITLRPTA